MTVSDALSAFGETVIAFDPAGDRIVWSSPALSPPLPHLTAGLDGATLDAHLPGSRKLLREATGGTDRPHAYLAAPDGTVFHVRSARGRENNIYLKIESALDRQKAQSRHLADRERLMLTWRSTSIGEMASTIAHELNQPLGSIGNLLNGLKSRAKRGRLTAEDAGMAFDRALEQLRYASGIIARMREYVDARQPSSQPLAPDRLATNTLDLLDWEIERERVQAEVRIDPRLPRLAGDEVMIQQVIVNLARNAIDAMRARPEGHRRLTIEAVADHGRDRIEIRIGDTGTGLDETQSESLFTPFFTTKASGMGIGLNICRSIIELHRGELWFTRGEEGGTTFHIALPMALETAEAV